MHPARWARTLCKQTGGTSSRYASHQRGHLEWAGCSGCPRQEVHKPPAISVQSRLPGEARSHCYAAAHDSPQTLAARNRTTQSAVAYRQASPSTCSLHHSNICAPTSPTCSHDLIFGFQISTAKRVPAQQLTSTPTALGPNCIFICSSGPFAYAGTLRTSAGGGTVTRNRVAVNTRTASNGP